MYRWLDEKIFGWWLALVSFVIDVLVYSLDMIEGVYGAKKFCKNEQAK